MKKSNFKRHWSIRVEHVSLGLPILTSKQWKYSREYVQNKAKKYPSSKRNKTTELKVLILTLGLDGGELLNLNIADLPCSHGRNSIDVRSFRGTTREVYLDESLETKINEYVKKYRKDADRNDPLFLSCYGNRTSNNSLYQTLRRLSGKLGFKPLCPSMFKRTKRYQLVGYNATDKNIKKTKEKIATLKEFMRSFCAEKYSDERLNDFTTLIYNANARGRIELPKHIEPWKEGQSKKYKIIRLAIKWSEYQHSLRDLPNLNSYKIRILLQEYKELPAL